MFDFMVSWTHANSDCISLVAGMVLGLCTARSYYTPQIAEAKAKTNEIASAYMNSERYGEWRAEIERAVEAQLPEDIQLKIEFLRAKALRVSLRDSKSRIGTLPLPPKWWY